MKLKTLYILLMILGAVIVLIMLTSSFRDVITLTSGDIESEQPCFIIDAGHGGEDGGAVVSGVLEKDVNLAIAHKLAAFLSANGFSVTEVRDKDISVYSDGAHTLCEKKTSDLQNRVKLFNESEHNIVVSIHQNHFDDTRYHGTQVFYSPNNEDSADLAACIRRSVTELIQPDNTREIKKAGADIYILKETQVPAVIVECGFLSNPDERAELTDEEYQNKLAYAIMLGLTEYYNNQ